MTSDPITVPPPSASAAPAADPYRYGWRYVRRELPEGGIAVEQVPLTLEDVLHPEEGDQVTESDLHERRRRYLADVFEARLRGDPTAAVISDVRIAWDVPGLRPHGPDIAVILGVRERKNWSTFDVAEEGVRPALIVDLTSPETASNDRSEKFEHYHVARVPLYVVLDAVRGGQWVTPNLYGYRREPAGYQALPLDERGRLWLEPVRAWLGVVDEKVIVFDEADRPLGDFTAQVTRAEAAETRAEAAAEQAAAAVERAEAAEARIRDLEAELRRLRGEV